MAKTCHPSIFPSADMKPVSITHSFVEENKNFILKWVSVSRSFFFIFHLFLVEFLFVFLFINADHVNSATRCDTSLLLDVYNWSCDHILFNDAGNFSRPNVQRDACSTTLTQTLPVSFVFSHFSTSPRSTFKPLLSEEKAWPGTAFMNGLECETAAAGLLRSGSHLKHSVMT